MRQGPEPMKKILCLTSHDLNTPDYGAVLRARKIFQMLSRFGEVQVALAGHNQDVIDNAKSPQAGFELLDKIYFPPTQRSRAQRMREKLNPRFLDLGGRQAAPGDRERIQKMVAKYDLIWVHGMEVANGLGIWRWPKTVMDIDDIPSSLHRQRLSQAATLSGKYWECRQEILWRRNEKFLAERFDAICTCSELDRKALNGNEKFFVLPNGFDARSKNPLRNPGTPPQIGFVGTFKYPPNRDGVRWFIENAWPIILKKLPKARLRLAGEAGEKYFNGQNIEALGWVPDMESEMANWSLAIVPVLVGGGTRIKILEAFSRKCPVISSSLGAYGHDVKNGHELLMADSPEDFATHCVRILNFPQEGERLAQNAWNKFLRSWTWEAQAGRIAEIVGKICGKPGHFEMRKAALGAKNGSKNKIKTTISAQKTGKAIHAQSQPPHVSVVIPAFNREHSVAKAVESVLAQTFNDFEIIAIDDGSSDGTAKVLKKFGRAVRLIRQKNRGVSAARNTGIRAARGKWIAFLDSDDHWHPKKLEQQINALEKHSAKICFTRCVNTQNEPFRDLEFVSATLREPEIFSVQNALDAVCLSPRHPMIQTMVIEKKLMKNVGFFDESLHAAEDAELIFRLSFLSGFIYIDRPLTTIHENSVNSLTYSKKLGSLARRNQSYLRLLAQMYWRLSETSPEKLSVMRKRLGYFISRRAEIACAAGEQPVARALARDGIFFAGSFRDFARCAGILLLPNLIRTRAQKKWPT
jgi:glycosyltransferase involved in cell wall biosynthesis